MTWQRNSGAVKKRYNRGMEQSVARRAHNPKVTGSSPVPATNMIIRKIIDIDSSRGGAVGSSSGS